MVPGTAQEAVSAWDPAAGARSTIATNTTAAPEPLAGIDPPHEMLRFLPESTAGQLAVPSGTGEAVHPEATSGQGKMTSLCTSPPLGFVLPDPSQICMRPEDWGVDDRCGKRFRISFGWLLIYQFVTL